MATVTPVASVCLVAVLACASLSRPALSQLRAPELHFEYARAEALAEAEQTLEDFDRNLSRLSGDFENFEQATRHELTIRRERLLKMQEGLRHLVEELEVAPEESWTAVGVEIESAIEEMDRIFEEINSLLGPLTSQTRRHDIAISETKRGRPCPLGDATCCRGNVGPRSPGAFCRGGEDFPGLGCSGAGRRTEETATISSQGPVQPAGGGPAFRIQVGINPA